MSMTDDELTEMIDRLTKLNGVLDALQNEAGTLERAAELYSSAGQQVKSLTIRLGDTVATLGEVLDELRAFDPSSIDTNVRTVQNQVTELDSRMKKVESAGERANAQLGKLSGATDKNAKRLRLLQILAVFILVTSVVAIIL